jgi:hypothetical protein
VLLRVAAAFEGGVLRVTAVQWGYRAVWRE